MVITVFMLFLTVSERKSKVRLISEISEFSVVSIRANSKTRKSRKHFSQLQNDFNFMSNYDSQR